MLKNRMKKGIKKWEKKEIGKSMGRDLEWDGARSSVGVPMTPQRWHLGDANEFEAQRLF